MEREEPPRLRESAPIPLPSGAVGQCAHCGHELMAGTILCPRCGARVGGEVASSSVLAMIGMALMALFLSGFGTCSLLFSVPSLSSPSLFALVFFVLGAGASFLSIQYARRLAASIRARRNNRDNRDNNPNKT